MSGTDFQSGREALGARLRELRAEAGLNGKELAQRLGWAASKVSRLQAGKQTPSADDLEAWAHAVGRPGVVVELKARLAGLETTYRSWGRQLVAGHRARQEQGIAETAATTLTRAVAVQAVVSDGEDADRATPHGADDLRDRVHGPPGPAAAHRAAPAWMFRRSRSTPTVASQSVHRRRRGAAGVSSRRRRGRKGIRACAIRFRTSSTPLG
ncbi:helix-turn-helix domain-containing protein [Streptomyces roseolus]|uniref:helix-turn-helix domain-containing protein n=1 Tax=Streptomyces roseolus TaxID=67358 RepID=UPI0019B04890|nr:hypothetical protein GCM10010282_54850 [Streptomyces roseolus]